MNHYTIQYELWLVQGGYMSSITLHNIDSTVEKKIRQRALLDHTSLNQTIQKLLREALHLERSDEKKADFTDLAGTWNVEDAEEFEKNTSEFNQIDTEMWK